MTKPKVFPRLKAGNKGTNSSRKKIKEPKIQSIHFENKVIQVRFEKNQEALKIFAGSMWELLKDSKADNYVELTLLPPGQPQGLVVLVKKQFGKTPHQFRVEAEKMLVDCQKELARLKTVSK